VDRIYKFGEFQFIATDRILPNAERVGLATKSASSDRGFKAEGGKQKAGAEAEGGKRSSRVGRASLFAARMAKSQPS
jgi:hypothetical protein